MGGGVSAVMTRERVETVAFVVALWIAFLPLIVLGWAVDRLWVRPMHNLTHKS